jgi:hypothetical protein
MSTAPAIKLQQVCRQRVQRRAGGPDGEVCDRRAGRQPERRIRGKPPAAQPAVGPDGADRQQQQRRDGRGGNGDKSGDAGLFDFGF